MTQLRWLDTRRPFVIETKEVLMIESYSVARLRSQIETVGCLLASRLKQALFLYIFFSPRGTRRCCEDMWSPSAINNCKTSVCTSTNLSIWGFQVRKWLWRGSSHWKALKCRLFFIMSSDFVKDVLEMENLKTGFDYRAPNPNFFLFLFLNSKQSLR